MAIYGSPATPVREIIDLAHQYGVSGFLAWVTWLFVHLMQLVMFQNRVLVLVQWAWHYITYNRSVRLITGEVPTLKSLELDRPREAAEAGEAARQ